VGPLILSSVSSMDIYVASSIFMILSLILVIGNFVADCILALLDPRIRDMAGGAA
jgi:peptide/nickel transport system permease protein